MSPERGTSRRSWVGAGTGEGVSSPGKAQVLSNTRKTQIGPKTGCCLCQAVTLSGRSFLQQLHQSPCTQLDPSGLCPSPSRLSPTEGPDPVVDTGQELQTPCLRAGNQAADGTQGEALPRPQLDIHEVPASASHASPMDALNSRNCRMRRAGPHVTLALLMTQEWMEKWKPSVQSHT